MSTNYIPKFSDADTVVDSSIQDTGSQVIIGNPILSPALTGTPTAPTATAGTNTTQVATTAFVTTAVAAEVTARETLEDNLTAEISAESGNRVTADTTLQANITAEATNRSNADATIQGNLVNEATTRAAADTTLTTNLAAEVSRAMAAIVDQTFAAAVSTNPYSATPALTPRRIGDRAYNTTSLEWWDGIATAGATTSWQLAASGGGGSGDMTKAVYDTANRGYVDRAVLADTATTATTAGTITGQGDAATKNVGTTAGTVAAGNDSRLPSTDQKAALAGTSETPSASNPYATKATTDAEASARSSGDALALKIASNLSDLNNAATARTNLGLGTAATTAATAYATAAQGALADSAVQPAAIVDQTFAAAVSTNPYSATPALTPRRIGDRAYNTTSLEWWDGVATAGATTSWQLAASGGSGSGDMTKAVYDTVNRGYVDRAVLADTATTAGAITGQGDAATKNVGTTAGTVAAGNDARIVAGGTALQPTGSGASLTGITASQVGAVPTARTVNGHALSSDVSVTAGDVGLGNCDNTSDANKPVSSATQTALNAKQAADADLTAIAALSGTSGFLKKTAADTWSLDTNVYITGNQSVTLSGDATGSGTTAITVTLANTAVTAGSYGDATHVTTVTVDAKGRLTAAASTSIQIAESQVTNLTTDLSAKAPLASPTFTGTPAAPTAAAATNTTQVATTAFVVGEVATEATARGTGDKTTTLNSQSAAYTLVIGDAGKTILHPSADTAARTFTIDSNANVAYPAGTVVSFVNQHGAGVLSIAITSDTMRLAGAGTTGTRTLAADGMATALKVTTTEWIISGVGLT